LTSERASEEGRAGESGGRSKHEVLLGDQACPRCRKFFTVSYWSDGSLVQARCLSCDLKWPRPDVV
jgi:NMD protein affecting ribosome stability and mRNA decay